MKKSILFIVAAVFAGSLSFAQEIDFGAKAGVNYAAITGDGTPEDSRIGIVAGLLGEYRFNDMFGLQVEAVYSSQGAKLEGGQRDILGQTITSPDIDYTYGYINIPVLAKFYLGESGFSINAGPQLGILVSDSVDFDGDSEDFELEDDTEAETIDFSVAGGVSYTFLEGTSLAGFLIDARYNLGLTDIQDGTEWKHSVIQVSLGYMF